jgi:hypothetical protein
VVDESVEEQLATQATLMNKQLPSHSILRISHSASGQGRRMASPLSSGAADPEKIR